LPPGGLPVVPKRKPKTRLAQKPVTIHNEEDDDMKINQLAAIALATAGTLPFRSDASANGIAQAPSSMVTVSSSEERSSTLIEEKQASSTPPHGGTRSVSHIIPDGFSSYAVETIDGNDQCVVGAWVDDDDMNQKPFVYVTDPHTKRVIWGKTLDLPANTYQGRITHCLEKNGSLYVVLQSDTQSEQTLSQTFLRIEKISVIDGKIEALKDISIPNVDGAYSAWVNEGKMAFHTDGEHIVVSGQYFRMADADKHLPFQVTLGNDLSN
jgi:hypothetical protein